MVMTVNFIDAKVWQSRQYGSIPYENLTATVEDSRFHEDQAGPRDAQVVGRAWKIVNKNGGTDRRRANNYQIPRRKYRSRDLWNHDLG